MREQHLSVFSVTADGAHHISECRTHVGRAAYTELEKTECRVFEYWKTFSPGRGRLFARVEVLLLMLIVKVVSLCHPFISLTELDDMNTYGSLAFEL